MLLCAPRAAAAVRQRGRCRAAFHSRRQRRHVPFCHASARYLPCCRCLPAVAAFDVEQPMSMRASSSRSPLQRSLRYAMLIPVSARCERAVYATPPEDAPLPQEIAPRQRDIAHRFDYATHYSEPG